MKKKKLTNNKLNMNVRNFILLKKSILLWIISSLFLLISYIIYILIWNFSFTSFLFFDFFFLTALLLSNVYISASLWNIVVECIFRNDEEIRNKYKVLENYISLDESFKRSYDYSPRSINVVIPVILLTYKFLLGQDSLLLKDNCLGYKYLFILMNFVTMLIFVLHIIFFCLLSIKL